MEFTKPIAGISDSKKSEPRICKLKVVYKDPQTLIANTLNNELYGEPENNSVYSELKASILVFGILTPIIIQKCGKVRAGEMRRKIAIDLGIISVPCIVEDDSEELKNLQKSLKLKDELMDNYRTILHDLRKTDTVYSKLIRKEILEEVYDMKQGNRSDLKPEIAAAFKERNNIASKSGMTKLNNLRKYLESAFLDNKTEQDNWLKSQGTKATLKTMCRDARKLAAKLPHNETPTELDTNVPVTHNNDVPRQEAVDLKYDYIKDQINVFNQSCFDLSIIPDRSIQLICTSPPYIGVCPPQEGVDGTEEIGTEPDVETYTNRLVECFVRCLPKLTNDATIWVNMADVMKDGCFKLAPEIFLKKMVDAGFKCKDKVWWVKTNAQPGDGDNTFQNVEHLMKFSICDEPYTNYEWLADTSNFEGSTFGKGASRIRLSSFVNLKNGFVTTSAATTAKLRQACSKAGFYLEHKTTYPPEIAYLCVKLSCRENSNVLDIFNGCGNSAVALLHANMNLTYYGIEINSLSVKASQINIEEVHGLNSKGTTIPFYPNQSNEEKNAA